MSPPPKSQYLEGLLAKLAELEKEAERYRLLRKVTPYRFKKMQDASVTDGGDVIYFHADRFDAQVDALNSKPDGSPEDAAVAKLRAQLDAPAVDRPEPAVVPVGYCIMPKMLTAENGAKALLLGEFKVEVTQECSDCAELDEPNEHCEICDGEGEYDQRHTIPWDQIKFIYSKAVEGLCLRSTPPADLQDNSVDQPAPASVVPEGLKP